MARPRKHIEETMNVRFPLSFAFLLATALRLDAARTATTLTGDALPAGGAPLTSGTTERPLAEAPSEALAASQLPLSWQPTIQAAVLEAEAYDRPVLVFFHSPGCGWCARLRLELESPELRQTIQGFARAEIDIDRERALATRMGIEGVPTLIVAGPDGRERQRLSGFAPASQLRTALNRALSPATAAEPAPEVQRRLVQLENGKLAEADWAVLLAALGDPQVRAAARRGLASGSAELRATLVSHLRHAELAVRLGALDLLEELAGDDFGFEAWTLPEAECNLEPLRRWDAWRGQADAAPGLYVSLPPERVASCLNDLLGADRDRVARATRALIQAGASCLDELTRFLAARPELAEGTRRRVEVVRLAVQIPPLAGLDASALAHHLVFGTPDTRLRALDQLAQAGRAVVPVLQPFLGDTDAMVRAAAVEALAKAGGREVTDLFVTRMRQERDSDVLHALLVALAKRPDPAGGVLILEFTRHANESLAVAALAGLPGVAATTEAHAALRQALADPRWRVRVAALEAAAKMRPAALAGLLADLTRDRDDYVRLSAVKALVATRKGAALATLEELFLASDDLKPVVVASFVELEKAFPESFAPALKEKPADLLLSVLTPIEDDGTPRQAALALAFTDHPDADVACVALRITAAKSVGSRAGRAALIQALETGSTDRQLAVLESLAVSAARAADSSAVRERLPYAVEVAGPTNGSPASAAAPAPANADVDALFAAFGAAGVPTVPAAPVGVAPAPAPPAGATPEITSADVFGAFLTAAGTSAPAVVVTAPALAHEAPGDRTALHRPIRALMQRSPDLAVQRAAALTLAADGAADGVARLAADVEQLSAEQRAHLAAALVGSAISNAMPLARRLLRDATPDVRDAMARTAFRSGHPGWIDAVLEEVSDPQALLKPGDLDLYAFTEAVASSRAVLRRRGTALIAAALPDPPRVLGCLLIETVADSADIPLVERQLADPSPFIRRAAFRALAGIDAAAFLRHVETAAYDPSPLVRETVPAFGARQSYAYQWVVRFGPDSTKVHHRYDAYGAAPAPTPAYEAVVRRLLDDPDATVRIGAALALLEARRPVRLTQMAETLGMLPPGHRARELTGRYVSANRQSLGPAFRVLLPYLELGQSGYSFEELDTELAAVAPDSTDDTGLTNLVFRSRTAGTGVVTRAQAAAGPVRELDPARTLPVRLVFFHQTGCRDCERVRRWLRALAAARPEIAIEVRNIGRRRDLEFSEVLSQHFDLPLNARLVAPMVFGGAGVLVRDEITPERLAQLAADSRPIPLEAWYPASPAAVEAAEDALVSRGQRVGLLVALGGGLVDSLNPCAFATLIFFISYLQALRRRPREVLHTGIAFISGVFLAYLAIGLGLREIVGRIEGLRSASLAVNGAIALLTLVLAFLNLRDGLRCRQGRMAEMTLQLPASLKERIHATVRGGVRSRRYVVAAFGMAVAVSLLELVCTGQGYLPVITYLWQAGYDRPATAALLVAYNLAFVAPLAVVFVLAYRGLRSEALIRWMNRHAATTKFATAALFLALFALIAWQVGFHPA